MSGCPCGTATGYDDCCGPVLRDPAAASTAEALMRSRYTAFVRADADHLLATWHPATRPTDADLRASLDADPPLTWRSLTVLAAQGGPDDVRGLVEFEADFDRGGRAGRLHEASRFRRQQGRWLYVRGRAVWT